MGQDRASALQQTVWLRNLLSAVNMLGVWLAICLQNWGKELKHWLGDRVDPVVVDDTKADKVKKFLQVQQLSASGLPVECQCTVRLVCMSSLQLPDPGTSRSKGVHCNTNCKQVQLLLCLWSLVACEPMMLPETYCPYD